MRRAFIETLLTLAEKDPRIILLTGDLGFMVLDSFRERLPQRFFNMGVAEQNMMGVATGLAEAGLIPVVYSIVNFACLRPFEFIRNGPIVHQFPVRIIGVGGGFEYGYNGITHFGLEDISMMRTQPGITVIVPADAQQARSAILNTWDLLGPVYYRLGKDEDFLLPGLEGRFRLGKVESIGTGEEVLLITMGGISCEVKKAQDLLFSKGISSTIMIVSSFNPSPIEDLANALQKYGLVITVESHYITGGLGSLVAEIIAEYGIKCKFMRCAVKQRVDGITGRQSFLNEKYGLSSSIIAKRVLQELRKNNV